MKRFLSLMVAFIFLAVSFIPQGAMAAGGIRVQVSQGSTAASTQSISPKLRIYNDGSSSVDLSQLTVKYYYTVDGDKTQQFFCDYAVTTGSTSGSKVITSSVKGAFTKLTPSFSGADYALVVSFTDGTIEAGGYADVQTRIAKSDWTNYNQADDYSFQGTSSAYADAGNIPAFLNGNLVWGNSGPVVTPTPVDPTPTPVKVTPTPVKATPTPTPASATPTPDLTGFVAAIGTVKGAVGDTVQVPVTFNKIPSGINNCDFSITYDSTALSLTSVDAGSIVTNPTVNFSSSLSSGKAVILFTDETQGTQPVTKDGVFANLSFKILSNTGSVVKLGAVGAFSDVNLKDINVAFTSGGVNVGGSDVTPTPNPTVLTAAIGNAGGQIGDTVTVPITFSNVTSGINNCDFTLLYDSNNVELSAVNAGGIVTNPSVNFTSNISSGKAVILFTDETQGTQSIAKDGVFANLTFKIKGSADSKLASAINLGTLGAFSDVNLNDIKVSFTSGAVMIGVPATSTPSATPVPSVTPTPCVTSTPTPVVKGFVATIGKVSGAVGDTVTVPVSFSGSPSAINNCDFTIVYDSTNLDFVSAAAGDIVTNPSVNFTTAQTGGMVVILFTDETQGTQPITKDGVFANLTFKIKGAADVKLGEIGAFCDTGLNDIPVSFVDGSVNIAQPVQNFVDPTVVTYDARKLPAFLVTISTKNALTDVMNGTAALKAGTDYTVSGNKLSVAPGYFGYYFGKFPNQDMKLTLKFSSGDPVTLTVKPFWEQNAILTPSEVKIDQSNPVDISVSMTLYGNTFLGVNNGTSALNLGTDYTVSGNVVTVKKSYIKYYVTKFPTQNLNLIFKFSDGYDQILSLYIGDSPNTTITPTSVTYKVGSKANINVTANMNGNFFSSITNGTATLVPRVDYTYAVTTNTLIINGNYMTYYFSKFHQNLVLVVNFTGGKPVNLTVIPDWGTGATPTPTATPVVTPTPKPVVTPTATATPVVTATPKPVVTPTATPVVTPTATPVVTPTPKPVVTPTPTPVVTPTATPVVTPTATPVVTPTPTPVVTPTPDIPKGLALSVGKVSGAAGTSVVVPVKITGVTKGINNADFRITYDTTKISSVTVAAGDAITNPSVNFSSSITNGKVVILFTDETQGDKPITTDGVFANLTVQLASGATGTAEINISDIGAVCDKDLNDLTMTVVNGNITIK